MRQREYFRILSSDEEQMTGSSIADQIKLFNVKFTEFF